MTDRRDRGEHNECASVFISKINRQTIGFVEDLIIISIGRQQERKTASCLI